MRNLLSIQYLRAIAALMVVAFHAGQWVLMPVTVTAAGVDIFFLISGFVMWGSTWAKDTGGRPISPLEFLRRRLIRVAPLYWLATLALAAGVLLLPGAFPNVTVEPAHLIKSLLFIPHLNPMGGPFPLLAVGWTLNSEVIFYMAFAAALLARPRNRMAVLVAILLPLSCLGLFYFSLYPLFANPMLLQFLAGAVIARLWIQGALPSPRAGLIFAALGAAALVGTHWMGAQPDYFVRPLLWGVPAFFLVLGFVAAEPVLPICAAFKRLGDASYSLYLVHTPVMALLNKILGPSNHPILFFSLAMAVSITAGLVCHAVIERPLLARLRRPKSAPEAPASSAR